MGKPLLRGAPIPVRFLRAQGTLQLRVNTGGVGAISQGTGKAQDYQGGPASASLQQALPEDLIRKIAEYRLRVVREREDDAFW